jgi:hypothetical protein
MNQLSQIVDHYTNINDISVDFKVGRQFIQTLKTKGLLIVSDSGYYNWNKAHKPSVEIINSILLDISITNRKYTLLRKKKQAQPELIFDSTPKPRKKRPKKHLEPQIEQLGLIRKLLKFIW